MELTNIIVTGRNPDHLQTIRLCKGDGRRSLTANGPTKDINRNR